MIGQTIGNIEIQDRLGQGGMGAVYRGFDTKLHRMVAVKTIHKKARFSKEFKFRFLKEARILSHLDHPNICRVYDYIDGQDADYLVLEFLEGTTLKEAEADYAGKLKIVAQVISALMAAHEQGIVHRDLKPENIMITTKGVKVLDFGIARSLQDDHNGQSKASIPSTHLVNATTGQLSSPPPQANPSVSLPGLNIDDLSFGFAETIATDPAAAREAADMNKNMTSHLSHITSAGTILGTLRYMSPEQARGEQVGTASDLYSLGVIIQELFTGQEPYPDLSASQILERVSQVESQDPYGLDNDLTDLINRLKSARWEDRPDAPDAARTLAKIISHPERLRRRKQRALLGTTLLIIFAISLVFTRNYSRRQLVLERDGPVRLVMLPFGNRTGTDTHNWITTGLVEMVHHGLRQSPGIDPIPMDHVHQGLAGMGVSPGETQDHHTAPLLDHLNGQLVVTADFHKKREGFLVRFAIHQRGKDPIRGTLSGSSPTEVGELLMHEISRRLGIKETPAGLDEHFAKNSFLNQIYARGLHRFEVDGPAEALNYFEVCIAEDPDFAMARLEYAEMLIHLGRLEESRNMVQVILDLDQQADAFHVARALSIMGQLEINQSKYEEAVPHFQKALTYYEGLTSNKGLAETYHDLALCAYHLAAYEEATRFWQRALDLARGLNNKILLARMLSEQAQLFMAIDQTTKAEDHLNQALEIYANAELHALSAVPKHHLGNLQLRQNRLDEARTNHDQALTLYRQSGNQPGQLSCLLQLAESSRLTGDFDLAMELIQDAHKLADRVANPALLVECLALRMHLEARTGQLAQASAIMRKVRADIAAVESPQTRARVAAAMAYVNMRTDDLSAAEASLARIGKEMNTPEYQLLAARLAFLKRQYKNAARLAEDALSLPGPQGVDVQALAQALTNAPKLRRRLALPDQ